MSEINVEVNTKKLEFALRFFPEHLKHEIKDGFDHIIRKYYKTFFATRLSGRPGIQAKPGGMKRQFGRNIVQGSGDLSDMKIEIFTPSKVAAIHEQGATLRNPRGGKLAIPLSARKEMFTSSGRLKKQYRKPRSIKNVIEIDVNGKKFLARKKSKKSSEIKPLFVLKNFIKIKPRLGFYQTWDSMTNANIQIIDKSIQKAIDKNT